LSKFVIADVISYWLGCHFKASESLLQHPAKAIHVEVIARGTALRVDWFWLVGVWGSKMSKSSKTL
jgi:hypothetical protein